MLPKNKSSYIGQVWQGTDRRNDLVILFIDEKLMIEEITYTEVTFLCLAAADQADVGCTFIHRNVHQFESNTMWKRIA